MNPETREMIADRLRGYEERQAAREANRAAKRASCLKYSAEQRKQARIAAKKPKVLVMPTRKAPQHLVDLLRRAA